MFSNIINKLVNREILKRYEEIKISDKALWKYKYKVKDNSLESDEELIKKLKRDYLVSTYISKKDGIEIRSYGNLLLQCNGNEIISITNIRRFDMPFNEEKKTQIDKILGIGA